MHDDCADGYFCDAGSCVETVGAGEACDEAAACDFGLSCVDGVCCDRVRRGCGVRSVAAGATADGTCTVATRGSA
ncbi:MAG: EB domain-containing protein [Polyangiales bacterium]